MPIGRLIFSEISYDCSARARELHPETRIEQRASERKTKKGGEKRKEIGRNNLKKNPIKIYEPYFDH